MFIFIVLAALLLVWQLAVLLMPKLPPMPDELGRVNRACKTGTRVLLLLLELLLLLNVLSGDLLLAAWGLIAAFRLSMEGSVSMFAIAWAESGFTVRFPWGKRQEFAWTDLKAMHKITVEDGSRKGGQVFTRFHAEQGDFDVYHDQGLAFVKMAAERTGRLQPYRFTDPIFCGLVKRPLFLIVDELLALSLFLFLGVRFQPEKATVCIIITVGAAVLMVVRSLLCRTAPDLANRLILPQHRTYKKEARK